MMDIVMDKIGVQGVVGSVHGVVERVSYFRTNMVSSRVSLVDKMSWVARNVNHHLIFSYNFKYEAN